MPFDLDAPKDTSIYKALSLAVNQGARFAVPFFFVISGYFWGAKIRRGASPVEVSTAMAKRIATVFLVWSIVYLLPYREIGLAISGVPVALWDSWGTKIIALITDPAMLLQRGTEEHLWFLSALLCGLALCAVLVGLRLERTLVVVSVLLFIVGVLGRAYAESPIGLSIDFNTRNGPFFATLLFASGYWLSAMEPKRSWFGLGLAVLCLGTLVHVAELTILWRFFDISPIHDYLFGTYAMGLGAAMVGLSNHRLLDTRILGHLGRLTLGIYAMHFVFIDLLGGVDDIFNSPIWDLAYVALVLGMSVAISYVLSRSDLTRRFV